MSVKRCIEEDVYWGSFGGQCVMLWVELGHCSFGYCSILFVYIRACFLNKDRLFLLNCKQSCVSLMGEFMWVVLAGLWSVDSCLVCGNGIS